MSDEVSRIAGSLALLSSSQIAADAVESDEAIADIKAEKVRAVIRARRLRSRYLPDELFADPAWDIMLELLAAEISQQRIAISNICAAAAVPATTALRWLKLLERKGMVVRRDDPHDARRSFVELTFNASLALRRYFSNAASAAAI